MKIKKINYQDRQTFQFYFFESIEKYFNPILGFDIIKFDDSLKSKYGNYENEKISMSIFIEKKFGKKAVRFINRLLNKPRKIKRRKK